MSGVFAVAPSARIEGHVHLESRGFVAIGPGAIVRCTPVPVHFQVGRAAVIVVGAGASLAHGVGLAAQSSIRIGARAHLGPFTLVMDSPFHSASDHASAPAPRPVVIGEGAILGAHVTVLPGAIIGPGARVRAGSVVHGSVPAGATVAGVPAAPVGELARAW